MKYLVCALSLVFLLVCLYNVVMLMPMSAISSLAMAFAFMWLYILGGGN